MILKNYTNSAEYILLADSSIRKLENYAGPHDGFFQEHAVGLILFGTAPLYLQIDSVVYDLYTISDSRYLINGNMRSVEFRNREKQVIKKFSYDVFWIEEIDLLEFAFELPEDLERDLLKYISLKVNDRKDERRV